MTLLISVVTPEYSLSASDQRITATLKTRTRVIDERFNKHIYFGTGEYIGNISYTGLALWHTGGTRHYLYDVISASIASIIESNPSLGALTLHISQALQKSLPNEATLGIRPDFELHLVTRHNSPPINTLTVISTFRELPPWGNDDGMIYHGDIGTIKIFTKVLVEESDIISEEWKLIFANLKKIGCEML